MKVKKSLFFSGVLMSTIIFFQPLSAQKKLPIFNPSFEDNKLTNTNYAGYAPPPWSVASVILKYPTIGSCTIGTTPDLNPFGLPLIGGPKPDDKNFMEGAYANSDSSAACHGGEAFFQKLCKPMLKGVQYTFNIRALMNDKGSGFPPTYTSDSALFGVYGANTVPGNNEFHDPEVLYIGKVSGSVWQSFTVTFTPINGPYDYLIIGGFSSLSGSQSYIQFDNITNVDSTCGMTIMAQDTTICREGCADIIVNRIGGVEPVSYSWNGSPFVAGDSTRAGMNAICNIAVTSNYTVVAIDANQDTAKTVFTISVQKPTVNVFPPDTSVCFNDSIHLTANGAISYLWSPSAGLSNTLISDPWSKPTAAGTFNYYVIGTDSLGCLDTAYTKITVKKPVPNAYAGPDLIVCPLKGDTLITLTATGGDSFKWSTGQTTQSITVKPTSNTVYSVVVTSTCGGATASDAVEVKVQCDIVIPNVITPNGDKVNDLYAISGLDSYPGSSIEIFDRWGLVVYRSDDYRNDWDGTDYTSNKEVSDGVYYYILSLANSNKDKYAGFIQVLRH